MSADKYFDGRCWVVNRDGNQCAGRTLDQAEYTAQLIHDGRVWFDHDGIGLRIKQTIGPDGAANLDKAA